MSNDISSTRRARRAYLPVIGRCCAGDSCEQAEKDSNSRNTVRCDACKLSVHREDEDDGKSCYIIEEAGGVSTRVCLKCDEKDRRRNVSGVFVSNDSGRRPVWVELKDGELIDITRPHDGVARHVAAPPPEKKSVWWNAFSVLAEDPTQAFCNLCGSSLSAKGGNTSAIRRHVQRCNADVYEFLLGLKVSNDSSRGPVWVELKDGELIDITRPHDGVARDVAAPPPEKKSVWWNAFSVLAEDPAQAFCNLCGSSLSARGGNTSTIQRHVQRCNPDVYEFLLGLKKGKREDFGDSGSAVNLVSSEVRKRKRKPTKKEAEDDFLTAQACFAAAANIPLEIFDHPAYRDMIEKAVMCGRVTGNFINGKKTVRREEDRET